MWLRVTTLPSATDGVSSLRLWEPLVPACWLMIRLMAKIGRKG